MSRMSDTSQYEIEREYRIIKQTLSMHSDLRDEYKRKASSSKIMILVSSAFVCSTTFASVDFYNGLGLPPGSIRFFLGIASVAAFASSLSLLVLDWAKRSTEHNHAADQWSNLLKIFRVERLDNKTWPPDSWKTLADLYWQTDKHSIGIPGAKFNRLKARYLRKVLMSRLQSKYPGSPRFVIWLTLRKRHLFGVISYKEADVKTN